mgnify:CR=1 FL=1
MRLPLFSFKNNNNNRGKIPSFPLSLGGTPLILGVNPLFRGKSPIFLENSIRLGLAWLGSPIFLEKSIWLPYFSLKPLHFFIKFIK